MKLHKILTACLLMAMVMALCLIAVPTKAEAATDSDFTYTVTDGEVTITGYTGSATDLTIPSTLGGYPVTTIGVSAFERCTSLENVVIGNGLITIGWSAFEMCTNLRRITIPGSVTTIRRYAFSCCSELEFITIPDSVTTIDGGAFESCTSLENVLIGNGLTTIDDLTFYNCTNLQKVTIGDSVTTIGWRAFQECSSLRNVYYAGNQPQWLKISIESNNTALTSATINYQHIHDYSSSSSVVVEPTCTEMGCIEYACICGKTYREKIPAAHSYVNHKAKEPTCTEVGWEDYQTCENCDFTNYTERPARHSYQYGICTECRATDGTCGENLTWHLDDTGTLSISGTGTMYDYNATLPWDDRLSSITSVVIGDSVTSIGSRAFFACDNLCAVTIGTGVVCIGADAFSCCTSLSSIIINDNVAYIGADAFYGCDALVDVYITDPSAWCKISFANEFSNPVFLGENLRILDVAGNEVTEVVLDSTVTQIPYIAFSKSNISSITIPNSVTTIGNQSFSNCYNLTSVTMGVGVTTVDFWAFRNCRNLQDVYYAGTEAKWADISIGPNNSYLTSATIHYQHVHDYTLFPSVTVDPTCTESGYIEYTCAYGETYRKPLLALGHITDNNVALTPPTCTEQGYTACKCTRCDEIYTTDYVAELGHNNSILVVSADPTCTDQGYTVYRCSRCGETHTTDYVSALGHNYSGTVTVVAPTCKEQGYTITQCIRCDSTEKSDYTEILNHDYTGMATLVEPTCTEQGYTQTMCIYCDSVRVTDYTDVVAHKMILVPAVAPTCTTPGLTVGTACQWCGIVGVAQKEVAALGGSCDYTADPTTCGTCGFVRAQLGITSVVLRPTVSGIYFKGAFTLGEGVTAQRYGIAVSVENALPVADDSDPTCLYTNGYNSALIKNILDSSNGKTVIYARAYVLLEDGTYIYGDVVETSLYQVVLVVDSSWDDLTETQKTAILEMYESFIGTMQIWALPNIKENAIAA